MGKEKRAFENPIVPDLVFLDIHMPKLTGLEVLQQTALQRGVIFTTAHDQHALDAFDLHAVDYLLKPFSQERFDAALQRARQLQGPNPTALQELAASQTLCRVLVREGTELRVLPLDEVDYIEAQADYVAFHHAGREHSKPQRISELEAQLDPRHFARVHRSFIVNRCRARHASQADCSANVLAGCSRECAHTRTVIQSVQSPRSALFSTPTGLHRQAGTGNDDIWPAKGEIHGPQNS